MPLPRDLKHYGQPDAFQLISPRLAFDVLIVFAFVGVVFARFM